MTPESDADRHGGREAPIVSCRRVSYCLDLRVPWVDAHGRMTVRRGWIVEIRAGRLRGFGDCAPLPSAGTETLDGAEAVLDALASRLEGLLPSDALDRLPEPPGTAPAARCGVETALLDLVARARNQPLCAVLSRQPAREVEVNGVLGPVDDALARLPGVLASGHRVLKLKLGTRTWAAERPGLAALVAALPRGTSLRLDVNGAWSFAEAAEIIPQLARWPVECLEEPAGGATHAELAQLQGLAPFPLALDESLAPRCPNGLPVRRQVLKPMAVGGPAALVRRAGDAVETVVTTTVDSAVGAWAAAHAAAAISGSRVSGQSLAHGLATSDWLTRDLADPPLPHGGRLTLPGVPGLGAVPDFRG